LILDEIWSIDFRHFRLKSSFGTAIKFWGDCWWSNLIAYLNVAILALLISQDPSSSGLFPTDQNAEQVATQPGDRGFQ
jgi:hypothetical protein